MVVEPIVIFNITSGHTEYVPIRANISGPQKMANKNKHYCVTVCRLVQETAPDSSGRYLIVKLM